jgi:hypothetical protein
MRRHVDSIGAAKSGQGEFELPSVNENRRKQCVGRPAGSELRRFFLLRRVSIPAPLAEATDVTPEITATTRAVARDFFTRLTRSVRDPGAVAWGPWG